jgi:hypothetical protein
VLQDPVRESRPTTRPRVPDEPRPARTAGGRREPLALALAAVLTFAAWLPFLDHPLGSDESGFLLLAQHWAHGSSLYGNYWVDRPPLLLWLFDLAAHTGPVSTSSAGVLAPAVKLLGALASGTAVLLTGLLARRVAPAATWPRRGAVVLAVALLCSPLLGMPETDGEVLAVPLVLLGLLLLVGSARQSWGRRALLLTVTAGAAATCAALVKQNVVDVFVFAVVALAVGHRHLDRPAARAAAFVSGAAGALAVALGAAAAQGTSVAGVWDAIVVFRFQATAVIGTSASSATPERMHQLIEAFVASGAAVVLVVTAVLAVAEAVRGRQARHAVVDGAPAPRVLAWPALATVAWELVSVACGGSYWLHYLTGLVPGLVLLLAIARPPRRAAGILLTAVVSYVVLAGAVVWVDQAVAPVGETSDAQVAAYLRAHGHPSDGVVVGFGHPGIVVGSGMSSPYEHLWSLPVRVRDPRLIELQGVLSGPDAPAWVVTAGSALDTWGLDATSADRYLRQHYVTEATLGDWYVWHRVSGRQP